MTKRAAKSKRKAPTKQMGRPTTFSERLAERVLQVAAKEGATDAQLAHAAGVSLATFKRWKAKYPDFRAALKDAKTFADELVEASLFARAVGFKAPAIKIFCTKGGVIVTERYTENYPPDTTAAIFWLKNRRPDLWRDVSQTKLTDGDGNPLNAPQILVTLPSNGREAS